jgi:thiol-disulfide isomerase/thioredoxin
MKNRPALHFAAAFGLALTLVLALAGPTFARTQQRPPQPPEYNEVVAATRITDAAARLKEFERLKAAYPQSTMMPAIDMSILNTKIELAPALDAVLELQKSFAGQGQGQRRLTSYLQSASQILEHPQVKSFDKDLVLVAVLKYKDGMTRAAADPETFAQMPNKDEQKAFTNYYLRVYDLIVAQAYLNADNASKAMTTLVAYRAADGAADAPYGYTMAKASEKLGRTKEAYEAYLIAAVENYEDSAARAKALYEKINGKADGFEAQHEAKLKSLPFHPEPFKAPADGKGKAVLIELFTGSECPPCVGADLGFDGLIETYPVKYLAILEYHLPIPRPDPMMNPATKKRQDYYGVNSTPTVVVDGTNKMTGGGSRGMAEGKFKQYKGAIDPLLSAAPAVALKAQAARDGETVKVKVDFDKVIPGAEYHVVLVQNEENYKGSNGLQFHKLVVRDLVTLDPAAAKTAAFDLAASEKAADAYLTEFEKTYTRVPNFKWAVRHNTIARQGLKVVFFVQEKDSKKVLNAVVTEVK